MSKFGPGALGLAGREFGLNLPRTTLIHHLFNKRKSQHPRNTAVLSSPYPGRPPSTLHPTAGQVQQHRSHVLIVIRTAAGKDGHEDISETLLDVTTEVVFTPSFSTAFTAIRWPLTVLRPVVATEVLVQRERLGALPTLEDRTLTGDEKVSQPAHYYLTKLTEPALTSSLPWDCFWAS